MWELNAIKLSITLEYVYLSVTMTRNTCKILKEQRLKIRDFNFQFVSHYSRPRFSRTSIKIIDRVPLCATRNDLLF